MPPIESGNYGKSSEVKILGGLRQEITRYDEVINLGVESGNRFLDDELFPITLTLPLTTGQFNSATFIVNYHAVLILKQHLHADVAECKKWEERRNSALASLKGKIEAQPELSANAQTFTSKSKYRSHNLRRFNP